MVFRVMMIAAVLIAGPALARIPAIGDVAPPVQATDLQGKRQTLETMRGKKGTVLVFFQSVNWSPYCKTQLTDLDRKAADTLADRGYQLVALSYDGTGTLKRFAIERNIKWPLLSDTKSEIIDAWGLRDPQYTAGSRAAGVPRPAVFVIGADGIIKARLMEERYMDRPSVEAVLAAAP